MKPDLFRCTPLNTTLSRMACGARHERKIGRTCATCTVGSQHARGALPSTWPDGAEILAAPITVATLASLRIHLAIIEHYEAPPRRGRVVLGATVAEHAEREGTYRQLINARLRRGVPAAEAVKAGNRGVGRHPAKLVRLGHETLTLRAFARRLDAHPYSVSRLLAKGLSPEQVIERCA
jgi:hypothetical protein